VHRVKREMIVTQTIGSKDIQSSKSVGRRGEGVSRRLALLAQARKK
jgi:hypothetical protein